MGRATGNCRLCGRHGDLHDSHIIPRGVYDRIQRSYGKNENSCVHVDPVSGRSVQKSDQLKEILLCGDCEYILKVGEDYFYSLVDESDRFRLNQAVKFSQPPHATPGSDPIDLRPANVDAFKIAHFALGVLWRCNVSSNNALNHCRGTLGVEFAADIEIYLLGGSPFPESSMIRVTIYQSQHASSLLVLPSRQRIRGKDYYFWSHAVDLLGVKFEIFRGDRENRFLRNNDLPCYGRLFFQKEDFERSALHDQLRRNVRQTKTVGKLANLFPHLARRDGE